MKILCDRNMPYAAEAFGTLGEVAIKDGREMTAGDVKDVDLLMTRSTTKVNASLLEGSKVRFYGSAVIGTDHIDIPYLKKRGIPWVSAPGCNAESVANYVSAALLWLAGRNSFTLEGKTVGVIGVGNVGRRVCRHLKGLGLNVLACDPPRQRDPQDTDAKDFVTLEKILREADIITCHMPLTREGRDATFHMLDVAAFSRMKPHTILINAARGPVLDTDALIASIDNGTVAHAVIDCWENEPSYRLDLMARADLATPHIAGHAFEGKVNGTIMTYRAACSFLGVPATYPFTLPLPPIPNWQTDAEGRNDEDVLREIVLAVYDIEGDSKHLKAFRSEDVAPRAKAFDRQRLHYPIRRQYDSTQVEVAHASPALLEKLRRLGFQVMA